jgi:uncharacterized protein
MSEQDDLLNKDAFLGRGWSFPPKFSDDGVQMSSYEQDIHESLQVFFNTFIGERVNRYNYGCSLNQYAFEPKNIEIMNRIRNDITRAIILFEPRIDLEEVSFEEQPNHSLLLIKLTYMILRTNTRRNMVYPFFLNEGTNING